MASRLTDSTSDTDMASTPQSLLDACAAWWDGPAVQELLAAGADPNAAGLGGITPLLACFPKALHGSPSVCMEEARRQGEYSPRQDPCSWKQVFIVNRLLKHGADPWRASEAGGTPLGAAAAWSTKLLRCLLMDGEVCRRPHTSSSSSRQPTERRDPPVGGAADGSPEVQSSTSDSNTCSTSSSSKANIGMPADGGGVGMLAAYACTRGCPEAVQLLLDQGLVPDLQEALLAAVAVRTEQQHGVVLG